MRDPVVSYLAFDNETSAQSTSLSVPKSQLQIALRVQVPKYEVYTLNNNYGS